VTLWLPRYGRGQLVGDPWNSLPEGVWDARPRKYKILEIFLTGGLSPWETFYVDRPGTGASSDPAGADNWRGSYPFIEGLIDDCKPPPGAESLEFANVSGVPVHFGFPTADLWTAPDGETPLVDRTRVVVVRHNLAPHEGGTPIALTGLRPGSPRLAGLGTPIDRHTRQNTAGTIGRLAPAAYVIEPANYNSEMDSFVEVGRHGAAFRPPRLGLTSGGGLVAALQRGDVDEAGPYGGLISAYRNAFSSSITDARDSIRLRSKQFDFFSSAIDALSFGPGLRGVLDGIPATVVNTDCKVDPGPFWAPTPRLEQSLNLALELFSLDGNPAAYVGIGENFDGYDGHTANLERVAIKVPHLLGLLHKKAFVDRTLNLDETLIVLNTEFGRTPTWQGGTPDERNHHPEGTINVLIGGPIGPPGSGAPGQPGIAGAMDERGYAESGDSIQPADVRAGLLMAAGVNPIHDDIFSIGDLSDLRDTGPDEAARMRAIRDFMFGMGEEV
jgi:hypothetical protein